MSSVTGSIPNSYVHDTFGNLTASTGALVNPFQYTGRDYDLETGSSTGLIVFATINAKTAG